MNKKQIVVTIDTAGEVKIEALGFRGGACEKATAEIEKALGVPGKKTFKPERWQEQGNQQIAGQG